MATLVRGLGLPLATVAAAALVGGVVAYVPVAAVGVAGALGLVALLWVVYRRPTRVLPFWVFLLLVAGTKFRIRDASDSLAGALDGQVVLELALYGLLAAILMVVWRAARVRVLPLGRMELVAAGWVAVVLLSPLWSEAPTLSAVRAAEVALHAAAVAVFARLRTPVQMLREVATPLTLYVLGCAGLAAVVPQASGTQANSYEGVERFSWFAVHPITAATMATTAAILVGVPLLARATPRGLPTRVLAASVTAVLLAVAVATHSRGPLAAAIGALVLAFVAVRMSWAAIAMLAAGAAAAAMLVAGSGLDLGRVANEYASDGGWISRLVFRGQATEQVTGFSGRGELWAHVVHLIGERPVLGRGYQGARADLLRLVPWAGHAHNALLQAVLDVGLVGAGLVAVLLANTARVGALRRRMPADLRVARATVLAVAAYEVVNAVSSESFSGAPGLDTFLFLLCACLAERVRGAARPAPRSAAAAAPTPPAPGAGVPARVPTTLGAPLRPV